MLPHASESMATTSPTAMALGSGESTMESLVLRCPGARTRGKGGLGEAQAQLDLGLDHAGVETRVPHPELDVVGLASTDRLEVEAQAVTVVPGPDRVDVAVRLGRHGVRLAP